MQRDHPEQFSCSRCGAGVGEPCRDLRGPQLSALTYGPRLRWKHINGYHEPRRMLARPKSTTPPEAPQ